MVGGVDESFFIFLYLLLKQYIYTHTFTQLHEMLKPSEFQLAHTVFYIDQAAAEEDEQSQKLYASTFFNETVLLYYPQVGM